MTEPSAESVSQSYIPVARQIGQNSVQAAPPSPEGGVPARHADKEEGDRGGSWIGWVQGGQ
jgi:hypothetical protein